MGNVWLFALYFISNAEIVMPKKKKILKKVLQNLLQFVVSSPSKGAETILTLVHDVGSGNGKRKG